MSREYQTRDRKGDLGLDTIARTRFHHIAARPDPNTRAEMTFASHIDFASTAPLNNHEFVRVLDANLANERIRRCRIGRIRLKAK